MDQKIATYENKKHEIRRFIKHLDESCKLNFGPLNKYISPLKNPYNADDLADYKRKALGSTDEKTHMKKNCKFISSVSKVTDTDNRYYKEANSEVECDKIKGFWQPQGINRKNKFDLGVCWVTEKDKECSDQSNFKFLRPFNSKFKDLSAERITQSEKCNIVPGCTWKQQTGYTWDCVKGSKPAELGPATNPPADMPNREGLEDFIYRWYNSETSPETTDLIGEGNRCKGVILDEAEALLPPEKLRVKEFIDFRLLNPENDRDAAYLKTILSEKQFESYVSEWIELQRIGSDNFNKIYKQSSMIDKFYNKMDNQQMMDDVPLEKPKKVQKRGMFPSVPQSVVNMVMKHVAQTNGDRRGILAWHSTGSGKTCTATGVMDSFWDTDRPIIFASSIDAIASNPDYKFHECAMNLFPRFQQPEFKGKSKAESMALIGAAFKNRNIKFLSFAKLSNRVLNAQEYKKLHKVKGGGAKKAPVTTQVEKPKKVVKTHKQILEGEQYVDLDNAVLIIDEVHNLFRPLPNQKKEHERLEKELLDPRKHPNMKVVILTATPGDNIPDVLKLLNIIRNPKEHEIKLKDITKEEEIASFKNQIRGMISYFDMSSDTTKFPIVSDKQEFIRMPMSEIQFSKYIEAYKTIKHEQKNYALLAKNNKLSKYWEGARKYANMLFNFDRDMALSDFSAKMPYLLENIQKYPKEKHYVYSAFYTKMGYGGQGIVGIAKELEKKGYKKLTVKEAKKLNSTGKLPNAAKRYILAITTEIGEEGGSAGKNLHELIKIYNSQENKNGELIHVMLASQGFNEGIDLKAVRHIHFFEPLVTMASDKQTLGRAARYCSHADLDREKGEWFVNIHRYMIDKPIIKVAPDNKELITNLQGEIRDLQYRLNQGDPIEAKRNIQERIKDLKKIVKEKTKKNEVTLLQDEEIVQLEIDLKKIAASKDSLQKLKEKLKDKEKHLKSLLVAPKKKALDPSSVENVEEIIFKESRERMKELLTVYQCMKEAAIDCKALAEFHSITGHAVKCSF